MCVDRTWIFSDRNLNKTRTLNHNRNINDIARTLALYTYYILLYHYCRRRSRSSLFVKDSWSWCTIFVAFSPTRFNGNLLSKSVLPTPSLLSSQFNRISILLKTYALSGTKRKHGSHLEWRNVRIDMIETERRKQFCIDKIRGNRKYCLHGIDLNIGRVVDFPG